MTENEITRLLRAHAAGDDDALAELLARVYDELRRIARARLRHERADHTLAPTDLVHEAFLKLLPAQGIDWRGRTHFYAIASRAMRNVLVDYAVRRNAAKRGGGVQMMSLEEGDAPVEQSLDSLIAVGEAMGRLEQLNDRHARVVECRVFGGLSIDETAEALNISAATVSRDWTFARAWLHRELGEASPSEATTPA
jgi:RNA polymerase sigma factor (TIGR02999 family)